MDEETRAMFEWLVRQVDDLILISPSMLPDTSPCTTCGHGRRAHVVNGDADDPTPWPCEYPKVMGAPSALCTCRDYQPMSEDD
jgi:hypothetical protein